MVAFVQPFTLTGATGTGNFKIQNGKIIDPLGQPWIGKGINVGQNHMSIAASNDACQPLTTFFPKINFIRLNVGSNGTGNSATYAQFVNRCTALKIVVEIEDHSQFAAQLPPYTGGTLTQQNNWFIELANAFKNNPYVWFGTLNEPGSIGAPNNTYGGSAEAAITTNSVSNYNAIRGTGANNIIMIATGVGSGNPGSVGSQFMPAAPYSTMTNIVWDLHYYGWVSGQSTQQSVVNAALAGSTSNGSGIAAAQTITSADGIVPVVLGEYGNATSPPTVDPNGENVLQAVFANTNISGSACWQWNPNVDPGDVLVENGSSGNNMFLTPYGSEVAGFIAR